MGRSKDELRDAAVLADKVGARARAEEPAPDATDAWRSILYGRRFVVDRFEIGERGYFLIARSPSSIMDLRSLTRREADVLRYAIRGESHKLIAYRLGLSRSWVTKLLGSVMSKLGFRSQAQLVLHLASLSELADDNASTESEPARRPSASLSRRGER